MPTPFPQDTQLTAIAIAVRNPNLIADEVLPRSTPLSKTGFKYQEYPVEQFMTVPDTKVGRRSRVNQVDFKGKLVSNSTEDYGLEHPLPNSDITDAPDNTNLEAMTSEWLAGLVLLDREYRVAQLVFNPASYGANNATIAAADRFDNANSDPLEMLLDYLDRPILRPNTMTIGQREWRLLRTHPVIAKAANGTSGDKGAVTKERVAELLEIEKIVVGQARLNSAKPGQNANLQPCWAGGLSLTYQDAAAAKMSGVVDGANVTFGFTAQTGQRVAGAKDDSNIGLRGGRMVRVGETVKEVICAPSLGFFLKDVITPA
ncbi:phage capsid protein [Herbaspirillum lusitanum]|uniref:phage capsid protein n=1 Tax=Herbaspirillum lusitanum TaxID=213312 RepID=UPI00223850F2|nr:phage capsid protein [Herbaspirillum lusitanum]MCW5300875.1 phage capsid protein [Herbaspirillum lusitanum]